MEIDTEHFSLMKIMADRDFEIESRLNNDSFVEDLKAEWNAKTKLEKQEFISKFIESMVLEKDEENDSFKIIKINFRSRYLDELKKLHKADCIDLAKPTEDEDIEGIAVIKSTPRITKSELNEYIENLKEHYDVKYYEDYLEGKITADDCKYYKKNIEKFKYEWVKYIDNREIAALEEREKEADTFYKINLERNNYFMESMKDVIATNKLEI